MTMQFHDLAARAATDGRIEPDEILALRRAGWGDGAIDEAEAEALIEANAALTERSEEWCAFFVEALAEFVVNGEEPRGYVSDARAGWLIRALDADGRLESQAELELLVEVVERALDTPAALKRYAMSQIENAVLEGDGPTREAGPAHAVTEHECALLRRLIFAPGGDAPLHVSKAEAEMLFRLKDATLYEANAPEWEQLFVQGIANYLLGFDGHEPLTRERAAELETFMASECAGIGGFLGRMASGEAVREGFGSLLEISPPVGGEAAAGDEDEDDYPHLDAEETSWLHDQLEADEDLDPLEKSLVAFIAKETGMEFAPAA